ncbi:permease-like cell division protein FtsX, partial [Clavibacter michiganensis]|uniref:permease-like cell division protein FtsX n=1 Tax=Clavibacter michiganensis TaxID=28447 RepID=UPI00292DFCE5
FGLIADEGLLGLRRYLSMGNSVVLLSFLSLTFAGAAIVRQTQTQTVRGCWGEKAEVPDYMCPPLATSKNCPPAKATAEQIKTVEDDLAGPALSPLITEVTYEDKETTFKNWVERFGEEQANAFGVENMGVAFRVTMKDPQQTRVLTKA